jgi:archaeosine-15-forming tRNA-guanine transglycosylase
MLTAYIHGLHKHRKLLQQLDPVSKSSALLWSGAETSLRPEVLRAQEWLRRVKARRTFELQPFGRVPAGLKSCYPFGQSVLPDRHGKVKANAAERVANTLDYQFGRGAAKPFRKAAIESSRKTGRLRRLWSKDKRLLGTFRPSDGFFLPTLAGANLLGHRIKKVQVNDPDVAKLVADGKVLFAKFAKPSAGILPGEEVAVMSKNKLLATGRAKLNSLEMTQMQRGVAVDIRAT